MSTLAGSDRRMILVGIALALSIFGLTFLVGRLSRGGAAPDPVESIEVPGPPAIQTPSSTERLPDLQATPQVSAPAEPAVTGSSAVPSPSPTPAPTPAPAPSGGGGGSGGSGNGSSSGNL